MPWKRRNQASVMDTLSTISRPIQSGQSFEDLPIDNGVDTRCLSPGVLVSIRTLNSVYKLRLDEPLRGRGVASGDGEFINEESAASLIGATLTGRGSMVKVGWVLLGFKVILSIPGGELLTSRVQGISINGTPLAPLAPGIH
ncbi:MAG: hypothetical protein IH849_06375 [Acidobacteria bacterium]|nr:hypothetical protein [Acidobacteriota bacterium]